ncbi:MAG: sigma-54-dependent Fis family transcriptional regulator [Desulfobacterales bacterium]|nr:sigma-54-dependent Fis family transcriptional regulator [Deltaproteobacteria bacterium]NNK96498.1 sigma-54-dependent Fis family transcriptional regulator [Desulfobacterales bacterium]
MPHSETASKSILVVDDETSLRNTFRIFLERAGYETVLAVGSFEEAVAAISSRIFDLIVTDIVLGSHSGIDLLKKVRDLGIACPVVIVTGYPHVDTASEAVRLGAFDYIPKPVEKETLLKAARLAITQYRLEQGKQEAEQTRERYRYLLEVIFKSVSDSIISVDKDHNILKMNLAATRFFQKTHPDLQEGSTLGDMCPNRDLCQITDNITKVMKTGIEMKDHRVECILDGPCKLLSICISPLDDGGGTPIGAVLVFRDMSWKMQPHIPGRVQFHKMIGASAVMQNIYMMIENIGKVDTSLLITGASGTGKELAVHALHQESKRSEQPLVMIDCTAIPENLLESELFGHKKGSFTGADENRGGRILQAEGGTLFLDEIGNISMAVQLRLLRFLQEKTFYPVGSDKEIQVDVRVIAATNVSLREKVTEGSFREDLYFRLRIIDIHLPLLREREGDIVLLANHFLHHFTEKLGKKFTGISDPALALLCQYKWPGNVRELEHVIERACILSQGTTIFTENLPSEIVHQSHKIRSQPLPFMIEDSRTDSALANHSSLTEQKQRATEQIVEALRKAGGNKAKAARMLKIDRSTLYRKMRELHIDMDLFAS